MSWPSSCESGARRLLKKGFLLLVFLGFCIDIQAQSKLVLFSPQHALIQIQKTVKPIHNQTMIDNLPWGMIVDTLDVFNPHVGAWHYHHDFQNESTFWSSLWQKKVLSKTGKFYEEGLFLGKQQDSFLIQSSDGVVFQTRENIKVPSKLKLSIDPQIVIDWKESKTKEEDVGLSFFIDSIETGISYTAFYFEKDDVIFLKATLGIKNNSKFIFSQTDISVRVGSPHLPKQKRNRVVRLMAMQEGINSSEIDEYYQYELKENLTLQKGYTAIPLFSSQVPKVKKIYRFRNLPSYFHHQNPKRVNAEAYFLLKNESSFPWASGQVTLFSQKEFIGKAQLSATSIGQGVELNYGKSFDLSSEKVMLFSKRTLEGIITKYKIKIINSKKHSVEVELFEPAPGQNWSISESTHKYEKISANEILFKLRVPLKSTITLEYSLTQSTPHRK